MIFAPLVKIIPERGRRPALVLVGFLMMQQVTDIDWDDVEIAIPAFLTIILMPFTYRSPVGIGAGFVAWVLIQVVRQDPLDPPADVDRRGDVRHHFAIDPIVHPRRRLSCPYARRPRAGPLGAVASSSPRLPPGRHPARHYPGGIPSASTQCHPRSLVVPNYRRYAGGSSSPTPAPGWAGSARTGSSSPSRPTTRHRSAP